MNRLIALRGERTIDDPDEKDAQVFRRRNRQVVQAQLSGETAFAAIERERREQA